MPQEHFGGSRGIVIELHSNAAQQKLSSLRFARLRVTSTQRQKQLARRGAISGNPGLVRFGNQLISGQ